MPSQLQDDVGRKDARLDRSKEGGLIFSHNGLKSSSNPFTYSPRAAYNEGEMTQSIGAALTEWESKRRRMGCVAATDWFCRRVDGFYPLRLRRYMEGGTDADGNFWEHVVATDGCVAIDLAPYADRPREREEKS